MSQRNIDFGTFPDDPSADAIRTAFQKTQENFTELFSGSGSGVTSVTAGDGIQLGGSGSSTGAVIVQANIACLQVQSSTLNLGVLGSSSEQSYVLIPSSDQILTVDLPNVFTFTDLELTGNLTVEGTSTLGNTVSANYFIGDGGLLSNITVSGGSRIDNGTSNVVVDANGNVRTSVAGTSNVLTITNTGTNVSGYVTASGNVTANYYFGNGALLTGIVAAGGNANYSNFAGNAFSVDGANVIGAVADANYAAFSGNVTVNAQPNITSLGTLTDLTVTGNVSANYYIGNGALLTGIATGTPNAIVNGNSNVAVTANSNVTVSVAGNSNIVTVTGTGANVSGYVDVTGNVTAAFFIGDGGLLSNITTTGGTSISNGNSNVIVDANSNVRTSVAGVANVLVVTSDGANITGNLGVSGNATIGAGSGGNLSGANAISANTLIALLGANLGNSVAANFFVGNGSLLTGIATGTPNAIINGSSNVTVDANSNVRISVAGTANVVQVTSDSVITSANVVPSSNAIYNLGNATNRFKDLYLSGNSLYLGNALLTSSGNDVTVSGNIISSNANLGNLVSANFFVGDGGLLTNVAGGGGTSISNGTSNVVVDSSGNVRTSVAGNANVFIVTGTGANIAGNLALTGNVTANTISLTDTSEGSISGANSISANFFIGDGSFLTNVGGLSGNTIFNGTSNVVVQNSSNVTVSVAGNPNIMTATSTGVVVGGVLSVTGNSTTANIAATGVVTATGNIAGGNVLATTAMTAPRFISNVAQGTAPFVVTSNTIVSNLNANLLGGLPQSDSAQANTIVARNSAGSIAANNITGNLVTAAQPNITSVGTLTSLTVTGNASAGNLSTSGRLTVTGNSNVGNLGASLVIVTGNLTAANANITSNAVANYITVREDLAVGNTVYGGGSGGNITGANLISANFFQGDGGLLTNISAAAGTQLVNGNSNIVVAANSNITMATNGGEKLRIDTNGNVGIGTTSMEAKLVVQNSIASPTPILKSLFTIWDLYNNGVNGQILRILGSSSGFNILSNYNDLSFGTRTDGNADFTSNVILKTTGLVGIGGEPTQRLTVNGGIQVANAATLSATMPPGVLSLESANFRMYVGDGTGYTYRFSKRTGSTTTDIMTINDATNGVAIGTANTSQANLTIGRDSTGSTQSHILHFGYTPAPNYGFRINNTNDPSVTAAGNLVIERGTTSAWANVVSINNTGEVAISTPGSGNALTINGNTVASNAQITTLTVIGNTTANNAQITSLGVGTAASGTTGEIRATNNITAYYSSDARLKENVTPIKDSLDKVNKLSGVEFDWTDEYIKEHGGEDGYFVRKHDVGIIAQEVQKVLPEIVAERSDGMLAVKYEKIVALLIEAIKEQNAKIAKLEQTVAKLTGDK